MPSKHRKAKQEAKQEEVKYNTLDEDFLRRIFDEFDKDKSGYLEREECMAALFKIGSKLRLEDLDTDGDKRISFAEFAVSSDRQDACSDLTLKQPCPAAPVDGNLSCPLACMPGSASRILCAAPSYTLTNSSPARTHQVFTELTGRHTHPIFKGAQTNISTDGASKTGISIFAGSAHLNEAFMQRASHAWRKLGAVARESGFTHQNLQKVFKSIDLDHDGNLDPGEIRAVSDLIE